MVYCLENDDKNKMHMFRTDLLSYNGFDLYFVKTKRVEWEDQEVEGPGRKGAREGIQ